MTAEKFELTFKVIGHLCCIIALCRLFYTFGSIKRDFIGQICDNTDKIEALEKRVSKIEVKTNV